MNNSNAKRFPNINNKIVVPLSCKTADRLNKISNNGDRATGHKIVQYIIRGLDNDLQKHQSKNTSQNCTADNTKPNIPIDNSIENTEKCNVTFEMGTNITLPLLMMSKLEGRTPNQQIEYYINIGLDDESQEINSINQDKKTAEPAHSA